VKICGYNVNQSSEMGIVPTPEISNLSNIPQTVHTVQHNTGMIN
jgi:hypothetical protein